MIGDLGYYKVKDKIFYNKTEAILHANHTQDDVEWFYYKDKFDAVDWTVEPELSIDGFYRIRAQQIRDAYDYVVVFCSGGADSTNVIWSFLNNGIHVDEVVISEPSSGMRNYTTTTADADVSNHISEIKYAAIPLANKIKMSHPNVRITMNDVFQNMLDFKDEEWAFKSNDWIHPSSMARFRIDHLTHIKKLAEEGKKIGLVYGVDKPVIVCGADSYLRFVLVDYGVNVPQHPFDIIYPNVDRVLFYWTPELPEMLVKQSHMVAREIYKPENAHILSLMLDRRKPQLDDYADRDRHNKYERSIMYWIYPSIGYNAFQAGKPTDLIKGDHDAWLYDLHKSERVAQMIVSDANLLISSVSDKYLTDSKNAFKRNLYSWKLGHESQFKPRFEQSLVLAS